MPSTMADLSTPWRRSKETTPASSVCGFTAFRNTSGSLANVAMLSHCKGSSTGRRAEFSI